MRRFPDVEGMRKRISSAGGSRPAWSADGRELFYFDHQHRLTAVPVRETASGLAVGTEVPLLAPEYFVDAGPAPGRPYELTDHRFIMIKDDPARSTTSGASIVLVLNWIEERKRVVPHQ